MKRKILTLASLTLFVGALLLTLSGSEASASHFNVSDIACKDADFAARSAASDALSNAALSDPGLAKALFSFSGLHPCGDAEGRRAGLAAEVDLMLRGAGDPLIGKNSGSAANAQLYANLAAGRPADGRFLTIERAYARALAVMIQIRAGFQLVPGGAAEAFNRVQTCLNGKIKTSQGGAVAGVKLDCGSEAIRRAISDSIAPGFYIGFGSLPVINFGCAEMLDQAENGSTVEARWAGAQAYVAVCGADLSDVAANGSSAELRAAAVGPLATQIALGNAAASDSTAELRLASAWADGLQLELELDVDPMNCNPVTAATGNLISWSLNRIGTEEGSAAIAPLARYYGSEHVIQGNRCSLNRSAGPLTLTIAQFVPDSTLPLFSFVNTLP